MTSYDGKVMVSTGQGNDDMKMLYHRKTNTAQLLYNCLVDKNKNQRSKLS